MTASDGAPQARLRLVVYLILAVICLAQVTANIMRARSDKGDTPFLSANDRSRWATIRALGDQGVYYLDEVSFLPDGRRNRAWYSIDMVRHQDAAGRWRYYSSKPALYPTLLAGVYRAARAVCGADLQYHTLYMGRLLLVLINVLPLACYLWLITRLVDDLGTTDAGRIYVVAIAGMGTLVSTFSSTLNNHTPAAVTALIAVFLADSVLRRNKRSWWRFLAAGVAAGLTAANELPALSFAVLLGILLATTHWRNALSGYCCGLACVLAAFLVCNQVAHRSWRPPYMHRGDGALIGMVPGGGAEPPLTEGLLPPALKSTLAALPLALSDEARVQRSQRSEHWILSDPPTQRQWALLVDADQLAVRQWDDWYDYPGSYWTDSGRQGVDRGEAQSWLYALHATLGHHGLLSLTPVWLLSLWGAWCWLRDAPSRSGTRSIIAVIALTTAVCLAFYLLRPQIDRNYGGVSCGFRWMVWCTPLWLVCLIPAADRLLARRGGLPVAAALMAVSVFSATYPGFNPWTHPWLYRYWTFLQWIPG